MKRSKIIPVYKKGDTTSLANYRPRSILPCFSKVVEKLIEKRLSNYLDKHKLLTPRQFGFPRGYSTDLALIALTDTIKAEIDRGRFVGSVFIDYSKAFDSLNDSILFSKLNAYGITGPSLELLRSYLHDRQQQVCVSGVLSDTQIINTGVPQGSILGPLLFLIYINDFPNCLTSTACLLYADDTTVYTSDNDINALTDRLNNELNNINYWCRKNKLLMNLKKTKYMVFSSHSKPRSNIVPVYIGSHPIPASNECSFLGVQLDSFL